MKSPLTPAMLLLCSCTFIVTAEIENVWFRSFAPYSGRLGNFGEAITCVANTLIVTSVAKDTVQSEQPVAMLARYYSVFNTDSNLIWSTRAGPFLSEPPIHTFVDNSNNIITPSCNNLQRISLHGNTLDAISLHISDSLDYEISAVAQHNDHYVTGGTICYAETPSGKKNLCALVKRDQSSSLIIATISGSENANCCIGLIAMSNDAIAMSGTFGNPGDTLTIDTVSFTAGSGYDRFVIITDYLGHVQSMYVFDDDTYISNIAFDTSGDLYISGGFYGSLSIGRLHAKSKGGEDAFIAKISPNRSEIWIRTWGGQSTDDHCSAFTFQNDSLIWVTGSSSESIKGLSKTHSASLFIGSLYQNCQFVKDDILIPEYGRADGRGIAYHDNMLYLCGYYSGTIEPADISFNTISNKFTMFVASFMITRSTQEVLVSYKPVYKLKNPEYVTLNGKLLTVSSVFNRNAPVQCMIIRHNSSFQRRILNTGGGL